MSVSVPATGVLDLLAVELGEGAASEVQIGSHRQRGLILPPCQVELAGRRQRVTEIHVADGIAGRAAQERQSVLGSPGRRQRQTQVGADPLIFRRQSGRRLEGAFGLGPSPLKIIAVTGVVPDSRVLRAQLECFLVVNFGLSKPAQLIECSSHATMRQGLVYRFQLAAPSRLGDRECILIFGERRVEVALGFEDPSEVDMDLEPLAFCRRFVKVGLGSGPRRRDRPSQSRGFRGARGCPPGPVGRLRPCRRRHASAQEHCERRQRRSTIAIDPNAATTRCPNPVVGRIINGFAISTDSRCCRLSRW